MIIAGKWFGFLRGKEGKNGMILLNLLLDIMIQIHLIVMMNFHLIMFKL